MTVGDRIRKHRELSGISQTDLAEKIGVSKQTLYKYEKNVITNIPSDKIEEIAKVLNVSESCLIGWENKEIELINEEEKGKSLAKLIANENMLDAVVKLSKLQPEDKEMVVNLINSLYEKIEK